MFYEIEYWLGLWLAYEHFCVCMYKTCVSTRTVAVKFAHYCYDSLYAVLRVMCVVSAMLLWVLSHFMTELMLFCCFSTPHVCQKILEDPWDKKCRAWLRMSELSPGPFFLFHLSSRRYTSTSLKSLWPKTPPEAINPCLRALGSGCRRCDVDEDCTTPRPFTPHIVSYLCIAETAPLYCFYVCRDDDGEPHARGPEFIYILSWTLHIWVRSALLCIDVYLFLQNDFSGNLLCYFKWFCIIQDCVAVIWLWCKRQKEYVFLSSCEDGTLLMISLHRSRWLISAQPTRKLEKTLIFN